MRFVKKPIPVLVEFASTAGEIQSLEGPVRYAPGDALMTGAAGEHWPISRIRFEATYDPVPPTHMGENGIYLKKRILIEARQATQEERISLAEERGILIARAGDWVVTAPDGHEWVVANDIFLETYEVAER